MCTMWRNWDHRPLQLGEVGFLSFKPIVAGVDKWWDGNQFTAYRYTNIQFERFLTYRDETQDDFKM